MLVSISTMPAGKDYLKYVKDVQNFADFMHLDVCDGVYNKTTCFSKECAVDINSNSTIPMDCHLMTKNPKQFAELYLKSGANIITAHIEAFESDNEVEEYIDFVKANNALVGLSLEPKTSLDKIKPFLSKLDIVLVMSVQTGECGQEFDMSILPKVEELKVIRNQQKLSFKIEVDGGITDQTSKLAKACGADIVVSGSYVFKSQNKQLAIESIR